MDPDIATGISVPYGLRNKQQKALEHTTTKCDKDVRVGFFFSPIFRLRDVQKNSIMNNDDARKLNHKTLNRGTLTGEEPFIVNPVAFTSPESTLNFFKTKYSTEDLCVTVMNVKTNQIIFKEDVKHHTDNLQHIREEINNHTQHVSILKDPESGELLRLQKKIPGIGFNFDYLFRCTPAFEGQEPSTTTVFTGKDGNKTPLYVYARVQSMPEAGELTKFSVLSIVVGPDSNTPITGWGYQWKDLYQGIRMPQFEYAAMVVDMDGNLLLKSYQDNNHLPIFEVGPSVDADHAICCCVPLLPDGSQVVKYAGMAGKLALDPMGFLLGR